MDWNVVIERNREALKRVLATLVAMAGLAGEGATLPRHLHRAVMRLLRPAEAAARRLVIVAARGLVVPAPAPPRKVKPKSPLIVVRTRADTGMLVPRYLLPQASVPRTAPRTLSLPLFDALPQWGGRARPAACGVPRISIPGLTERVPIPWPPSPYDPIDAVRLDLRLAALGRALDDLPGHARRFARWRARRDAGRTRRIGALKPGRPPGSRRPPTHEVHEVLADLHHFAFYALEEQFQQKRAAVLDTS